MNNTKISPLYINVEVFVNASTGQKQFVPLVNVVAGIQSRPLRWRFTRRTDAERYGDDFIERFEAMYCK